jgi:hypothetical protein
MGKNSGSIAEFNARKGRHGVRTSTSGLRTTERGFRRNRGALPDCHARWRAYAMQRQSSARASVLMSCPPAHDRPGPALLRCEVESSSQIRTAASGEIAGAPVSSLAA